MNETSKRLSEQTDHPLFPMFRKMWKILYLTGLLKVADDYTLRFKIMDAKTWEEALVSIHGEPHFTDEPNERAMRVFLRGLFHEIGVLPIGISGREFRVKSLDESTAPIGIRRWETPNLKGYGIINRVRTHLLYLALEEMVERAVIGDYTWDEWVGMMIDKSKNPLNESMLHSSILYTFLNTIYISER